jgi:hypothetical protein
MEVILTSNHVNGSDTMNGQDKYKITRKAGNEMRRVRSHTRAPDTSPKLKSFKIRVNPEVTEEVLHHAGL